MTTLTEIVADLEPALLESLAAIRVALDIPAATATATLSFSLFRQPDQALAIGPEPLPDGVSASIIERWPDLVKPLDMETPIQVQIRDLDASGLVGHLDTAQFSGGADAVRAGHPALSYLIKTHAGSAAERAEWTATHNRKPGRPRIHQEPRRDLYLRLSVSLVERVDAAAPDNRTAWIEEAIRQRLERDDAERGPFPV